MKSEAIALVVLGCVVRRSGGHVTGLADGALRRRVVRAAREWPGAGDRAEVPPVVIASGGRAWEGIVEADAMADALVALGVPAGAVVRERASFTTRENALFTAALCARRGIGKVALVTCVWHLRRASKLFEAHGLEVVREISAGESDGSWVARAWVRGKERLLTALPAL